MKRLLLGAALAAFCLAPPLRADEPKKSEPKKSDAKSFQVPYRFTAFNHVMIRAKINGKGPFNFIVDTGAPALFVATEVCDKLGVKADKKGWGTFDRFEIEGGVVLEKAKGRVETPFQLEGMNGMGLAGAELHGMIGYNLLAKFRMEFDFSRNKMTWTQLDFDPPPPDYLDGREKGGAPGGLDMVGGIMKMLGGFLGAKATPEVAPRGFLGLETEEDSKGLLVKSLLAKGPASKAGLKAGDRILEFDGRTIRDSGDLSRFLSKRRGGDRVDLMIRRDGKEIEMNITVGEGL
jgi:hypothetical protein